MPRVKPTAPGASESKGKQLTLDQRMSRGVLVPRTRVLRSTTRSQPPATAPSVGNTAHGLKRGLKVSSSASTRNGQQAGAASGGKERRARSSAVEEPKKSSTASAKQDENAGRTAVAANGKKESRPAAEVVDGSAVENDQVGGGPSIRKKRAPTGGSAVVKKGEKAGGSAVAKKDEKAGGSAVAKEKKIKLTFKWPMPAEPWLSTALYFYSPGDPNGFLSQWYPSNFEERGVLYHTAEHYMMCRKAKLFGDEKSYNIILRSPLPSVARSQGRKVTGFDMKQWSEVREEVVETGNYLKFTYPSAEGRKLQDLLLATDDRTLVEANPSDVIWGIGTSVARAPLDYPWKGSNLLGKCLGRVRERIREEKKAESALDWNLQF